MARKRGLYQRKDSRYWWVHILFPDGRRVCQSTRCTERAEAEAFVVRLQSESGSGGRRVCAITTDKVVRRLSSALQPCQIKQLARVGVCEILAPLPLGLRAAITAFATVANVRRAL
jgi:hypothetical protein